MQKMTTRKQITNVLIYVTLATSSAIAPPLFAQASRPRVNNEKPAKVTGQTKRIHPHALKLILQGKKAEAHHLLSEIYHWFTEGFDTADLLGAKALLEEL